MSSKQWAFIKLGISVVWLLWSQTSVFIKFNFVMYFTYWTTFGLNMGRDGHPLWAKLTPDQTDVDTGCLVGTVSAEKWKLLLSGTKEEKLGDQQNHWDSALMTINVQIVIAINPVAILTDDQPTDFAIHRALSLAWLKHHLIGNANQLIVFWFPQRCQQMPLMTLCTCTFLSPWEWH